EAIIEFEFVGDREIALERGRQRQVVARRYRGCRARHRSDLENLVVEDAEPSIEHQASKGAITRLGLEAFDPRLTRVEQQRYDTLAEDELDVRVVGLEGGHVQA